MRCDFMGLYHKRLRKAFPERKTGSLVFARGRVLPVIFFQAILNEKDYVTGHNGSGGGSAVRR